MTWHPITHNAFFALPDHSEIIAQTVECIPADWEWMEGILCSKQGEGAVTDGFTHKDRRSVHLADEKRRAARLIRNGYRGMLAAFPSQSGPTRWQNPARCFLEFPFENRSLQRQRYILIARDEHSAELTEPFIAACRGLGLEEYVPEFREKPPEVSDLCI